MKSFIGSTPAPPLIHETIEQHKLASEEMLIAALCKSLKPHLKDFKKIQKNAKKLIAQMRTTRLEASGVDALMVKYNLSSEEGVALMCLAEAMLRIPDKATQEHLITDKLATLDWAEQQNISSLYATAATWGLMISGKIMDTLNETNTASLAMKGLIKKISAPIIRQAIQLAMKVLGEQFIMGQTIEEGASNILKDMKHHYVHSFDMLGEAALTEADAIKYHGAYIHAIKTLGTITTPNTDLTERPGISIKLSALHPQYILSHHKTCIPELVSRLKVLVSLAIEANIQLTIDAEESDRLIMSLEIFKQLFEDPITAQWDGFGIAIQSYQKRASYVIDWVIELSKKNQKRIMVRLIKGAYWDTEIKETQVRGLEDYPVFTRKHHTDVSFLACARKIIDAKNHIYGQFATHNAISVSVILHWMKGRSDYEFQCLHGMGKPLYDPLLSSQKHPLKCRIYAPVGFHSDLLPYLVRRLLENGANSSFINQIVDSKFTDAMLTENPIEKAMAHNGKPNEAIMLPKDIFLPERINSKGYDLEHGPTLAYMADALESLNKDNYTAYPIVNGKKIKHDRTEKPIIKPASGESIGTRYMASHEDAQLAAESAYKAFASWTNTPIEERAICLLKAADLLEENTLPMMALCILEAGKSLSDAVDELREAVDFLRYYAYQATQTLMPRNLKSPTGETNSFQTDGRGVALCISPWNFPLAIFTGQMAAALVAGNTVLAKPSLQTTAISTRMVELMHEAGIPHNVLHHLPGNRNDVAKPLVQNPYVQLIMLTGSTHTAKAIAQDIANRPGPIIPLVAETGGQNVMLVDSSALPEQIVQDVVNSAFKSAGQRCSACRVLFIQEDIADKTLTMIQGAMDTLNLGDTVDFSTDIGPIIDAPSLERLQEHCLWLEKNARLIGKCRPPKDPKHGFFLSPCAYEIDALSQLKDEVFGPILHIIRYQSNELSQVIDNINATGFGLTMGIQSRIIHRAEEITQSIHAGNIYINRDMIGAVVGVQPFGGEGLSGTGPKAGGPFYLLRLIKEKTITNNITAIGGNTTLMTLED